MLLFAAGTAVGISIVADSFNYLKWLIVEFASDASWEVLHVASNMYFSVYMHVALRKANDHIVGAK
jgi:hypothetical protein